MAKADFSRDYYADLELPSTADVNDIKKQFRKLALKYHPDRNPGKEAEVNTKFQTIQAAHEILTSPDQKSKYDSHRSRNASRYPTASGVRGNPWQDVASHYPMPPRRPGQAPTSAARNTASSSGPSTASSAHRYSSFNVPPSAKTSKEDLDSRYTAWKNMRPSTAKGRPGQSASAAYAAAGASTGANTGKKANTAGTTPSGPSSGSASMPPPPPRTASQRQKADASFGARRSTGFFPRSPMGDEPPAASTNNYFTNRTHSRGYFFGDQPEQPTPNPLGDQRRASNAETPAAAADSSSSNGSDESLVDGRQSAPYQTHGGEKLNPFDGVPASDLNRTKSYRTASQQTKPEFRRRSSSLPDESDNAAKATATARKRTGGAAAKEAATGATQQSSAASSGASANTSAPRSGNRVRPGVGPKSQYPTTSSPMPQFEEQYQRMQGEKQDPFTTPNAKSTQNVQGSSRYDGSATASQSNSKPPNNKNRPILYATPLSPGPFSESATPMVNPSKKSADGTSARAQRHPAPGEAIPRSYYSIYAPEFRRRSPKRRTSFSRESSSGDTESRKHKIKPGMNAFETRQFEILQDLVRDIEVFDPNEDSKSGSNPDHQDSSKQVKAEEKNGNRTSTNHSGECWNISGDQGRNRDRCSHTHFLIGVDYDANLATRFSSNLSLDDDVFSVPSTPIDQEQTNTFTNISADDINTRFVPGEKSNTAWEFSAGGSEGESSGDLPSRVRRSQSGSRLGRRSPGKNHPIPRTDSNPPPPPPPPPPPRPSSSTAGVADGSMGSLNGAGSTNNNSTTATTNCFDAGRWAEQIGSEHFVPQSSQHPPQVPPRQPTPNQQQARPIKKPKPIQRANTATRAFVVVDDDDESAADSGAEPRFQEQHTRQQTETAASPGISAFASPIAMDIDSPLVQTDFSDVQPSAMPGAKPAEFSIGAQVNGARNIPVEPTRPEWRAGNVDKHATDPFVTASMGSTAATAAATAAAAAAKSAGPAVGGNHVGGSEDSEEFRATLADIRKVEPFSESTSGIQGSAGTGLGSFGDLRTNLPFESKAASSAIPAKSTGRRKTISFPKPPTAPHPPPALAVPGLHPSSGAWDKYVTEFRHYMLEWTEFNNLYVDHFQARRHGVEIQRRQGDFDWLTSTDNEGINQYLDWMDQDEEIRARWSASCTGHDMNVRQFMAFRERMRQA